MMSWIYLHDKERQRVAIANDLIQAMQHDKRYRGGFDMIAFRYAIANAVSTRIDALETKLEEGDFEDEDEELLEIEQLISLLMNDYTWLTASPELRKRDEPSEELEQSIWFWLGGDLSNIIAWRGRVLTIFNIES